MNRFVALIVGAVLSIGVLSGVASADHGPSPDAVYGPHDQPLVRDDAGTIWLDGGADGPYRIQTDAEAHPQPPAESAPSDNPTADNTYCLVSFDENGQLAVAELGSSYPTDSASDLAGARGWQRYGAAVGICG